MRSGSLSYSQRWFQMMTGAGLAPRGARRTSRCASKSMPTGNTDDVVSIRSSNPSGTKSGIIDRTRRDSRRKPSRWYAELKRTRSAANAEPKLTQP